MTKERFNQLPLYYNITTRHLVRAFQITKISGTGLSFEYELNGEKLWFDLDRWGADYYVLPGDWAVIQVYSDSFPGKSYCPQFGTSAKFHEHFKPVPADFRMR